MVKIEPIGFFQATEDEKYAVSRQPGVIKGNHGKIILNKNSNFEEALADLDGFDRIFVIYQFSRNKTWKPKVMPPRGDKKRGVFATRSPHRPNFLGLSCLQLVGIEGLTLSVKNHDLLDGTPIFDIKPYVVYADCFPEAKQGWLEELNDEPLFTLHFEEQALLKKTYLENCNVSLVENISPRLLTSPFPKKQNRIKLLKDNFYEIAYKTWRLKFTVDNRNVIIHDIYSGYDQDTLQGKRPCLYNDLDLHIRFQNVSFWHLSC